MNRLDRLEKLLTHSDDEEYWSLVFHADLAALLAVAKGVVEDFTRNETCPVCRAWVPNDEFKHIGDCALGALLMEVTS